MSTDSVEWTAPAYDAATVETAITAFFARVATSGSQPRLRSATGVCQFDIAPVGSWSVAVKEGVVTVTKGGDDTSPATCVVACDAADFLCVLCEAGHMNLMTALMQERVTITGDLPFAYAVLGSFVFAPERGRPECESPHANQGSAQ